MNQFVKINPNDNIAVALFDMAAQTKANIEGETILIKENIKTKQKFALKDFAEGDEVLMYGLLIGKASKPIAVGEAITNEKLDNVQNQLKGNVNVIESVVPDVSSFAGRTFHGYHRHDGKVGTANIWLLIPLEFCKSRSVDAIESALSDALGYHLSDEYRVDTNSLVEKYYQGASEYELLDSSVLVDKKEFTDKRVFENIDGVKFLKYDQGHGSKSKDSEELCKLLANYINHPNTAGATILTLGCQKGQVDFLKREILKNDPGFSKPMYVIEQHQLKSEELFIAESVKKTFLGLVRANKTERKPAPLSKLTLGLGCAGSDGFSGITANPVLGYASDLLIELGGTSVLSEFPELISVEKELKSRCQTEKIAEKFSKLIKSNFENDRMNKELQEEYKEAKKVRCDMINEAMLSAGALQKAGRAIVVDVIDYTERISLPGLNLLCTSDFDVESSTGLAGAGCNLIVLTTGIGSLVGNPITPVVKMSSNTSVYNQMRSLIDIDAGTLILGKDTIKSKAEELIELLIEVASGRIKCKAEISGQNDFFPWKRRHSV